jgi:hypothetical protein
VAQVCSAFADGCMLTQWHSQNQVVC